MRVTAVLLLVLAAIVGSSSCASERGAVTDALLDPGGEIPADIAEIAADLPPVGDAAEGVDTAVAPTEAPVLGPVSAPPAGSLLPAALDSCPVYQAARCEQGTLQRCALYDAGAATWSASPNPWAEQIFVFDRYYDLYHRMQGQQAEFLFTRAMPPGTPEATWSAPDAFQRYEGFWDSAGWTGTALQAAAARYRVTGTPADYARLLDQFESMMFQYEATGVPGLLMRCHYAMLEEGAPLPVGHWGQALVAHTPPANWEDHFPLEPSCLARLPAYYTEGVDLGGTHYATEPKWMGHASRDMYVRSLPGILLAYDVLGSGAREDELRRLVRTLIPCTLRRLKKVRISNLQQSPEVREAVAVYLGGDTLQLEPGDLDLTKLDTLIGYVMEEPRPDKLDHFDPTCPDTLPTEVDPVYDLDASKASDFKARFLQILLRSNGQGDVPVAWIQVPSARGSDALFMAQWALAAHYLTGEARYRDFVDDLMREVDFWGAVDTMGSFRLPRWCRSHYGPSLLYPTLWNLQSRVDRAAYPAFWRTLGTAIHEEFRDKELVDANDAYFGVLYAACVDQALDPELPAYLQRMLGLLRDTRQVQALSPLEPHRSYSIDWVTHPPQGFDAVVDPLSAADRAICTHPMTLFGVTLEGQLADENPRAREGMALPFRIDGPFQWQEDPYQVVKDYGDRDGRTQWPASGYSVAYWTGRLQGTFDDGAGLALAWRATGEGCR